MTMHETAGNRDNRENMNAGNERVDGLLEAWLTRVEGKIDTMRQEIHAGDELRVSKEAFTTYSTAMETRIKRLEESPVRTLGWLGFSTGTLATVFTLLMRFTGH